MMNPCVCIRWLLSVMLVMGLAACGSDGDNAKPDAGINSGPTDTTAYPNVSPQEVAAAMAQYDSAVMAFVQFSENNPKPNKQNLGAMERYTEGKAETMKGLKAANVTLERVLHALDTNQRKRLLALNEALSQHVDVLPSNLAEIKATPAQVNAALDEFEAEVKAFVDFLKANPSTNKADLNQLQTATDQKGKLFQAVRTRLFALQRTVRSMDDPQKDRMIQIRQTLDDALSAQK